MCIMGVRDCLMGCDCISRLNRVSHIMVGCVSDKHCVWQSEELMRKLGFR
jgi:hypothetical protein